MNKTLTLQDYELISAHLDSACSAKEVALIEARLQTDPEFKQAMLEFGRTKRMLTAIPHKRAPRNFTLSPDRVPQISKPFSWAPALNFTALAASLMLVVMFIGSRFIGQPTSLMATRNAAPMMAEVASEAAADSSVSPMITWGQTGGYGGGAPDSGAYATGKGGGPAANTTQPTSTPEEMISSSQAGSETPATASAADSSDLILGLAPEEERGNQIQADSSVLQPFPWLLVSEVFLATVAIASVITSWILHRRD